MKVSEKFASNFLKADDLQGRKVHVVIASVGEEKIGDENHSVAYFRGKAKGLILNKTNASYLAAAIADEMDDWSGHEIVLYPTKVNFQGKMVDAIRIEMPPSNGAPKREPTPQPKPPLNAYAAAKGTEQPVADPQDQRTPYEKELSDEIPF